MGSAEKRLYDIIPANPEASWVVSYLSGNNFSSKHVRILRNLTKTSDRTLSGLLNLAPKTFVSYATDASKAKVDTKEHVLLLLSLLRHGAEVFGTEDVFVRWAEKNNMLLDNRPPIEFLSTISGIRMVDDRLTAMEYGDNV